MNGKTILAVALAATLVAGAVSAQSKGGPKLYRWVDKDGKVHYDDALPPEAVNQARTEFSAKTGSVAGQVERALTPEERAAQEAAARSAAEEVQAEFGLPVVAVAGLAQLLQLAEDRPELGQYKDAMLAYRARYGSRSCGGAA
jgi:hypothetical protein